MTSNPRHQQHVNPHTPPENSGLGGIRIGTPVYRRVNLAFFLAGFVTFVSLYAVQPLLPEFSRSFGVSPALGSLPLSLATGTLAVAMLFVGTLSETWGRKRVMSGALILTSGLTLLIGLSDSFASLLGLRFLQGLLLAGLPAVAMAYLSEEMSPSAIASAMGLYISGNAVGGMAGRLLTAILADLWTWQAAFFILGGACLLTSLFFAASLPPSHLPPRPFAATYLFTSLGRHLRDPLLRRLYLVTFLTMGAFVTLYNYLTFRLLAAPYLLSQSRASLIFLVYLLGSLSASIMGHFVNRLGRAPLIRFGLASMVAGALLTLAAPLPAIVLGVGLFTVGFFGVHSVASSWVGRRAPVAKAQASALYLFFYYLGSSVSGTVGGFFWSWREWPGVTGLIVTLLLAGLVFSARLARPWPPASVAEPPGAQPG